MPTPMHRTAITIRAKHQDGIHIEKIRELAIQHRCQMRLREPSKVLDCPMYYDFHFVFRSERRADAFRRDVAGAGMLHEKFGYDKKVFDTVKTVA